MKSSFKHYSLGAVLALLVLVLHDIMLFSIVYYFGYKPNKSSLNETVKPPSLPDFKTSPRIQQFKYVDTNGTSYRFADNLGKVVVVNIWASWCKPCMVELSFFDTLAIKVSKSSRVKVLCLSEENIKTVRATREKLKLTMDLYAFQSTIPAAMKSDSLPVTFVFNIHGELVFKHAGLARWDDASVVRFLEELDGGPATKRRRTEQGEQEQNTSTSTENAD